MILPLSKTQIYIAGALLALTLSYGAGYYTKTKFVQAERSHSLENARKGDIRIVADAAKREERITAALAENTDYFALKQKEFDALPSIVEIPKHEPTAKAPSAPTATCPRDPVLSSDVVKLLNSSP